MGGNAVAMDRGTGEVLVFTDRSGKKHQGSAKKTYFGVRADAQHVTREQFKSDFVKMFLRLNSLVSPPIWDPSKVSDLLTTGEAFNGSSESLFASGGTISDEEFVKHKGKKGVGDVDVTVPRERLQDIFDALASFEGRKITPDITYVGQSNPSLYGHQISSVFAYEPNNLSSPAFVQIDFEGVEYESGRPTEFAKFSHSSDWADVEAGIKGVFHKYLLALIVSEISKLPDAVKLTPTGKVSKARGGEHVSSKTFSVDIGIRDKYRYAGEFDVGGVKKKGYEELPTAHHTTDPAKKAEILKGYRTKPTEMFREVFGFVPTESDLKKFRSYSGLLDLLVDSRSDGIKDKALQIYNNLVKYKLFGKDSQKLQRVDEPNVKTETGKELTKKKYDTISDAGIDMGELQEFSQAVSGDPEMYKKFAKEVERLWTAYSEDYLPKKAAMDLFVKKVPGLPNYDLNTPIIKEYIKRYTSTGGPLKRSDDPFGALAEMAECRKIIREFVKLLS